jgi:TRAP-type transport system small permease protein
MRQVERIVDSISTVLAIIGAMALLAVMVAISADVIRRDLTGRSIVGVLELTEVLMVTFIFLGMAEAHRRDLHVRVGVVTAVLPARAARYVELFGMAMSVAFVAWMIHATTIRAIASVEASEYRFGTIAVPIWPARIAIPVGLAALLLQFVIHMYRLASSPTELDSDPRLRPTTDGF